MEPVTAPLSQNPLAGDKKTQTGSLIASDFETFLRMLTTQIQNQDPLNPMESTDFATQLATFSGVEQQVRSNDLLTSLNAGIARLGMGDTARWVGMEAQANMAVSYDGDPISLQVPPNERATRMELLAMNAAGQVVQSVAIDPRGGRISWTGLNEAGEPLPAGLYSFQARGFIAGEEMPKTEPVAAFAQIHEARMDGDQLRLVMAGGVEIEANDVVALRLAQ
ncbi:flagellar hook assembly protein FlgD [Rhodobacteraceae bacterium XHP0102]|nr:flagellar hook assembly protein FlgD [Rhodobacteraceae bacterium XHP0102]